MAFGYLLARTIWLKLTEKRLGSSAELVLNEVSRYKAEANLVLDHLLESPYPSCSDADISVARKALMNVELMKDAGRLRDGRIACTANLTQDEIPGTQFKPWLSKPDGSMFYRSMTPYKAGQTFLISIQKGDAFVVFGGWVDSYLARYMDMSQTHFSIVEVDARTGEAVRFVGSALPMNVEITNRDTQGRVGKVLYASRCSARYADCVTADNTVAEALASGRLRLSMGAALGGLMGAILGFFCSLLYRHNQNMEQQLRRAIRQDTLRMVYQPIVNLASRRIEGAETLVRWTDEEGFAVNPDVFIRIAEERGFVGAITQLVVRHALSDFASTLRAHPEFQISVNVAAADLADPEFLPMLERALAYAGVPARSLTIEITERSTARHDVAIQTILSLRQRGHSVHIDDFGTGYSSLAYLQDLAVDAIKIDRTFTKAAGTGAANAAILPKILSMAEALNLKVILEGIETESQAAHFAETGQRMLAQGWLFGRPLLVEEFHRRLAEDEQEARTNPTNGSEPLLATDEEISLMLVGTA